MSDIITLANDFYRILHHDSDEINAVDFTEERGFIKPVVKIPINNEYFYFDCEWLECHSTDFDIDEVRENSQLIKSKYYNPRKAFIQSAQRMSALMEES